MKHEHDENCPISCPRVAGEYREDRITCKCFYREDDHCFLGLPGPMTVCQGYKAPAKVQKAPLDPELAKRFQGINHPVAKEI